MRNTFIFLCLYFILINPLKAEDWVSILSPVDESEIEEQSFSQDVQIRKINLQNHFSLQNLSFSQLNLSLKEVWELDKFILPLEQDVEARVKVKKKIKDKNGKIHIYGKIEGDKHGSAFLVHSSQGLSGSILGGGKEYNLFTLGEGLHSVFVYSESHSQAREHSASIHDLFNKMKELKSVKLKSNKEQTFSQMSVGGDNFIDVLVIYTNDVSNSSADPESVIESQMDFTNQALEDSCANFRMRIVAQQSVNYTEAADAVADLNCITDPGHVACGANDLTAVAGLRETHGADLVQFITNTSNYCGLAWVGSEPFDSDYGYSVKHFLCGASTMTHELGHNMGLGHDRFETGYGPRENSPYGYGHGHVDLVNKTRTIMSYADQCTYLGIPCQRIGIFSNPTINKNGQAQGDHGFSDATKRINLTYPYVANFKNSASDHSVSVNPSCVKNSDSDKDVHCFIATAAYGSYLNNHVVTLRSFRDDVLGSTKVGKYLVKQYYKYSPRLAQFISDKPILKSVVRGLLTPVVVAIAYPIGFVFSLLFMAIIYFSLRKKKIFISLFAFFLVGLDNAESQIAQPSLFENQISHNPASAFAPLRESFLGYTHHLIKAQSGVMGVTDVNEEANIGDVNAGVMWATGGLVVQNQLKGDLKRKTKVGGDPAFTDTITTRHTQANLSVAMFEQTHLGIKYKQSLQSEKKENLDIPIDIEETRFGLGLMMKFSDMFFIGASADHVAEKGSSRPDTKWIEAGLGFGLSQRAENKSWLLEISATRSPEVLNQKDNQVASYGERYSYSIYLERELPMADSMFNSMTFGGFYKDSTERMLANYIDRDQKVISTGVNVGIKTFNRSIDAIGSYVMNQEKFGAERKETVVSLTLLYKFSGNIFSLANIQR